MSKCSLKYLRPYGDFCEGVHLFPSRTEQLSPSAQMVLEYQPVEYVVAVFHNPDSNRSGFFLENFTNFDILNFIYG